MVSKKRLRRRHEKEKSRTAPDAEHRAAAAAEQQIGGWCVVSGREVERVSLSAREALTHPKIAFACAHSPCFISASIRLFGLTPALPAARVDLLTTSTNTISSSIRVLHPLTKHPQLAADIQSHPATGECILHSNNFDISAWRPCTQQAALETATFSTKSTAF